MSKIFDSEGHLINGAFHPSVWDDTNPWILGYSDNERQIILNHLNSCEQCQKKEIDLLLKHVLRKSNHLRTINVSGSYFLPGFNIHDFDKYPKILMQEIIKYIKGTEIHFIRDADGQLLEINGITNMEIKSHCQFIYDNITVSIHCFCNNCEDNPTTANRLKFGNFHFYSIGHEIRCVQDEIDVYPEEGKIQNNHNNFKIFADNTGNIVKIVNNQNIIYKAEYNPDNILVYRNTYGIETKFEYEAGNILTKAVQIDNVIIEKSRFEYSNNRIEKVYDITNNADQLTFIYSYPADESEHVNLNLIEDGVIRRYFDRNGCLIARVYLPLDKQIKMKDIDVPSIKDIPATFKSVELVLIDEELKNIRIIQKEEGHILFDQTGVYNNGLLTKVINQKESSHFTCLYAMFRNRHWIDLTEFDDGVL